ncbi:hypothetical protein [Parasphingorhabdus sp.]
MTKQPTFQLPRLRDIGWAKWDPIGLGGPDEGWPADEYDSYLLQAASKLWFGHSEEEVADYLVKIETENMGFDANSDIRNNALSVAKEIAKYVATLPR